METKTRAAEIVHEFEVPGVARIHGVSFDGHSVWIADGTRGGLRAIDPDSGREGRSIDVEATAGTAFDGKHFYQVGKGAIRKVDAETGALVSTIPLPDDDVSGLAWAEGVLYAGSYRGRGVRKLDPESGAVLKTLRSERLVTGVTFVDGELWHGTLEGPREEPESDLRRIDPETGEVLERIELPRGIGCSGMEADDRGRLWFGDPYTGKLRAVKRAG